MIYNVTMPLHQFHLVCIPDVQNSIAVNGGRVEFWKGFFYCPANCILGEITGMSSSFVLYNRAPPPPPTCQIILLATAVKQFGLILVEHANRLQRSCCRK